MKIHIYNALKYGIVVQCKDPENRVNWGPRHQIPPNQGKEVHDVKPFEKRPRLQIEVYDEKKKLIKETNFQTPFVPFKGMSWVVKENGIVEQKWGAALWVENPSGKKFLWERDMATTTLQCETAALQKRLDSEKTKLTAKEQHISELEEKVEKFVFDEQKYTKELQEQQARCQNLEQQMNELQHNLDQSSALEQEKQELQERLNAEQATAQELKQRVEGFAFNDQRRVEELEKQQDHCQKLEEQIAYLNYDLNQFSKLKEEKQELQKQLAKLKTALVAQQLRSAVKGQTKEQLQALEKEKHDLQQQVEALGQKLNALEHKHQNHSGSHAIHRQERQEKYKRRQRRFLAAVSKNESPAELEKLTNKQLISRALLNRLEIAIQQDDVNELISLLNEKQFEQKMLRFLRFEHDNTALHIAVTANKVNMVQHFVTHPEIMPELNAVNKANKSALDIAREKGFDQIVKILHEFSPQDAAYTTSTSTIPYL